jgi:hypothetical protein
VVGLRFTSLVVMLRFKGMLRSFSVWVKRFFRANAGAVFILGFQVLLVACAAMLVFEMAWLAEGVAVVAYFLLVVGVVFQLVCFVRGSDGEKVSE